MKITVVGCGNAFSKRQFNQCFMLESGNQRLLIDFGAKVPYALDKLGIDVKSITDVYVSHLHGDHVGGLEELAFLRYDWIGRPDHWSKRNTNLYGTTPRLIGNAQLLKDLWDKSLRGGLESMEGFDATIETYFRTVPIQPNQLFDFQGWRCRLVQQVHIMTGSIISNTFGLFMEPTALVSKDGSEHPKIYFTTDSQHCSPRQIEIFYKEADVIFQDCECIGCDMKEHKFEFASGVHANFAQLAGWPSANSVDVGPAVRKKMYLSHYQDFVLDGKDYKGNDCDWDKEADEAGFRGFLRVGDILEV